MFLVRLAAKLAESRPTTESLCPLLSRPQRKTCTRKSTMKTSLCGLLLIGFQREVVPAQFDGRQHGDTEESAAMSPVHSMHPFTSEMVNCKSTWQLATSADLSSIHTSIIQNASPTVQKHPSTPWPLRVPTAPRVLSEVPTRVGRSPGFGADIQQGKNLRFSGNLKVFRSLG